MMKTKKALMLVADSKIGKFYLAENFKISSLIEELKYDDVCVYHTKENLGRFPKSGGAFREFAPHTDPKEVNRHCFSKNLAHKLHSLLEGEKYDQLILVCGSKILGDIRKDLPAHALKTIDVKEVQKDIAHHNQTELQAEVLDKLKFD